MVVVVALVERLSGGSRGHWCRVREKRTGTDIDGGANEGPDFGVGPAVVDVDGVFQIDCSAIGSGRYLQLTVV